MTQITWETWFRADGIYLDAVMMVAVEIKGGASPEGIELRSGAYLASGRSDVRVRLLNLFDPALRFGGELALRRLP